MRGQLIDQSQAFFDWQARGFRKDGLVTWHGEPRSFVAHVVVSLATAHGMRLTHPSAAIQPNRAADCKRFSVGASCDCVTQTLKTALGQPPEMLDYCGSW